MSLGQHFLELRKRLFFAAVAIAVCSVAGWFLSTYVLDVLRSPVEQISGNGRRLASLNFANVTGAFDLKLTITITVGVIISSPVWLYQIWAFIVPALVRKEKLYAIGFLGAAIPLFLAGCCAGFFVLPHIVQVMTSFIASEDSSIIDAKTYYDFVLKLVLAIGVAFVLPVFLVLLNFIGVLTAASIRKSWRVAIILITLFTAIVTPSADVISMILLAIPMVGLYLIACLVTTLHDRRLAKRVAALDAELAGA
ncbi:MULTISPECIES: twin-arginine translocase subunit TatC [unclassified Frondihabitans]|uniref:twin-arginine translocase subunit TatC n=1 Tax=unclassified Frondihabitans TaxID=2626248 RepID=UPI000F4DD322|nr:MULTISPECIES: twin-arginine translocase subunit TatC [unclassified Frondihabitans]RPE74974.1 sec-independent protein translocase protein TatC [Frondihabitans sp. PhB153]RPF04218.1 sec-independent protein translocase protein TatC [Frondihabitans sp. PhB161]